MSQHVNQENMTYNEKFLALCNGSTVRKNLLTVPGYAPYCGNMDNDCNTMERATWDVNARQFRCKCGWVSELPPEFVTEYVKFRIDSQVCDKCGTTVGEKKNKYCGDGSDKNNSHRWRHPT